jgi:threonine/homoserine/homoserine lactone efflux protein
MDPATFGLFVAALALLLVPGPAVFYVVDRVVEGGRVAGSCPASASRSARRLRCGRTLGDPRVLRGRLRGRQVAGRGVPGLAGPQRLFGRDEEVAPAAVEPEPLSGLFSQGVIVQVLSPKVALFFLAFLPQLVDPSRGDAWAQILVLGATLAALGLLTDGLYALLGGTASAALRRRGGSFRCVQQYFSGGVCLTVGAASVVSDSGKD